MLTDQKRTIQTVRSQYLGNRMRQLRERRGLALAYVASYLGVEENTLARCERAEWPFRRDHVAALLDAFEPTDDAARAGLLDLAQQVWRINEWQHTDPLADTPGGSGTVGEWWLLDRATELHIYSQLLIPPAVQTRDYAQAVIRHTVQDPNRGDKLVRRVLDRQQALEDRKPPTRLEILIDESALSRPVGGRLVLQDQLRHLTYLAEQRPHVKIRVLPTGWHPGLDSAFTISIPPRPYPPVALVQHHGGQLIIEADAAAHYTKTFDRLHETAMSPAESSALISTLAEELPTHT